MAKEIIATIGVDIDAVAGWIGSYGGANSPSQSPSTVDGVMWSGAAGAAGASRCDQGGNTTGAIGAGSAAAVIAGPAAARHSSVSRPSASTSTPITEK